LVQRRVASDAAFSEALLREGIDTMPQARNLFSVVGYLQEQAGLQLHVTAGPA
jgi:hypothetical protein